jgi:hypothetical protein
MKYQLLFCTCLITSVFASAQQQISLKDAAAYAGDSVLVCGKISGTRFFSESADSLTLLNVGAPFPNQQLTLVIREEARKTFASPPENYYKDKQVCVYGTVTIYNGKPQINIYKQDQIMDAVKQ